MIMLGNVMSDASGFSNLIDITLLPIGAFQVGEDEEVNNERWNHSNTSALIIPSILDNHRKPSSGVTTGSHPNAHGAVVPSGASSIASDLSCTRAGPSEGRKEETGREEKTEAAGKENGGTTQGVFREGKASPPSAHPSARELMSRNDAPHAGLGTGGSLATFSSTSHFSGAQAATPGGIMPHSSRRISIHTPTMMPLCGTSSCDVSARENLPEPASTNFSLLHREREEVAVCVRGLCRIASPHARRGGGGLATPTATMVARGGAGEMISTTTEVGNNSGCGGLMSSHAARVGSGPAPPGGTPPPTSRPPLPSSSYSVVPSGGREMNHYRHHIIPPSSHTDGHSSSSGGPPLEGCASRTSPSLYGERAVVCSLGSSRELALQDLMGYAAGSFIAEIGYRKPLSHCREPPQQQQLLRYPGPSVFYSAEGERAWKHFPGRPLSSASPLGYTLRADGSRQYLLFPVEEEKYMLSVVVSPCVFRLMGDMAVTWATSMGIRGYPISLYRVMEEVDIVQEKEEGKTTVDFTGVSHLSNDDTSAERKEIGDERGPMCLCKGTAVGGSLSPYNSYSPCHHDRHRRSRHRVPLYLPLHIRLYNELQQERTHRGKNGSSHFITPCGGVNGGGGGAGASHFLFQGIPSSSTSGGRRQPTKGRPWRSIPSVLQQQLQWLHDLVEGCCLSPIPSSSHNDSRSKTGKPTKEEEEMWLEKGEGGGRKACREWWSTKAQEVRRVCTERPSSFRFASHFIHKIEKQLEAALTQSSTSRNIMVHPGDRSCNEEMNTATTKEEGSSFLLTSPVLPPPCFHLTGYALWFRGEPLLSMGTPTTLEEVLIPAAISSTLGFSSHPSLHPVQQVFPYAPSSFSLCTSFKKGKEKENEEGRVVLEVEEDNGNFYHNGMGAAEKIQVQCTAMYSHRRAALLSASQSSYGGPLQASSFSSPSSSFPMLGAQRSLLRPEEVMWHAPGLIAVSCRTGLGWLMAMELEPTPLSPLGGSGGLLLSEVVSNAQRFLSGPLSEFDLLSSLSQCSVRNILRRPVSLYSESCVPLLHLVRACRIYYYQPCAGTAVTSALTRTGSVCGGVGGQCTAWIDNPTQPHSLMKHTGGGGIPKLHLLFQFSPRPLSPGEEKKRIEKIKKMRKITEYMRDIILVNPKPACQYEPVSCDAAAAMYPFPSHLAPAQGEKQKKLKKEQECIKTVRPNPMVQLCMLEKVGDPSAGSRASGSLSPCTSNNNNNNNNTPSSSPHCAPAAILDGGGTVTSSAGIKSRKRSKSKKRGIANRQKGSEPHWKEGDKRVLAELATVTPPPDSALLSTPFYDREGPSVWGRPTSTGIGGDGDLPYWRRIQPLLHLTAQLGAKRYRWGPWHARGGEGHGGDDGRRFQGTGQSTMKGRHHDARSLSMGTFMKTVSASPSCASLSCVESTSFQKWPSVFSFISRQGEGQGGGEEGVGGSYHPSHQSRNSTRESAEIIFHGISTGARSTNNKLNLNRLRNQSGGVLFVVIELKSKEEQKHLLFLKEHKRHGGVIDTREFTALSQWLLSKSV